LGDFPSSLRDLKAQAKEDEQPDIEIEN